MAAFEYPLASSTWGEEELAAAEAVLRSGRHTMGENVRAFESAFAEYLGSRHAVMVNSGSSANLLAVAALCFRSAQRLGRGDEVVVPAVSWSTTFFPLSQYGLKLKFVDVDRQTLNMDLEALAAAISDRTRLIVAVNLLGNPNDFAAIRALIAGRNILLMEDNCEALGAEYEGRKAGTFGIVGTHSTFFSHHISTMEGGVIVTDDEELHHIMLSLRAHGWTRELPTRNLVCGVKGDDPFSEAFRFVLPGYNLRPLEISAAVGIRQLRKLPGFIAARRANAAEFGRLFRDHPLVTIQREVGTSSWFGFALLLREDIRMNRRTVVEALLRNGIECRPVVAGNFVRSEAVSWLDHEVVGQLDNADYVDTHGLYVGNHHFPISSQLQKLQSVLNSCQGERT